MSLSELTAHCSEQVQRARECKELPGMADPTESIDTVSPGNEPPPVAQIVNGQPAAVPLAFAPDDLEPRVRRLEDAVSLLQDTQSLEERIVERVARRVSRRAARQDTVASSSAGETGKGGGAAAGGSVNGSEQIPPGSGVRASWQRSWLFVELYDDVRTMVRMYLDPLYHPTWLARVAPLALVAAILTSWIWLPGTAFLPAVVMVVLDKLIDLVLAYMCFKILTRELGRYRAALRNAPPLSP